MFRRHAGPGPARPEGGLLQGQTVGQAADLGPNRYQMRERLVDIGDDFWITTGAGRRAFKVNGQALRVRQTLVIEDPAGRPLVEIQERMLRVRDAMAIERGGRKIAEVRKDLVNIVRDHFIIKLEGGGPDMEARGNLVDHEYHITQAGRPLAEVSRRWFRIRDTYGVEVVPGQDDALILGIAVCIDQLTHAGEG